MKTMSIALVAALFGLVQSAMAGDCAAPCAADCCQADACGAGCGKICKLVCETKKIKVICWGCECEDFCVAGCSECVCEHCDEGCCSECGECGCDCECNQGPDCRFHWKEWIPGCAELRTRKKLIKYEAEKEVPSFKWEVVDAPCGHGCGDGCCNGGCADGGCADGCTDGCTGGCSDAGCTAGY